jgi:hypothetical protein
MPFTGKNPAPNSVAASQLGPLKVGGVVRVDEVLKNAVHVRHLYSKRVCAPKMHLRPLLPYLPCLPRLSLELRWHSRHVSTWGEGKGVVVSVTFWSHFGRFK